MGLTSLGMPSVQPPDSNHSSHGAFLPAGLEEAAAGADATAAGAVRAGAGEAAFGAAP